jgi:hypothetical protein
VLKEGGYEADSSLTYYGYYGPFRGEIETRLLNRLEALWTGLLMPPQASAVTPEARQSFSKQQQ